MLRIGSDVSDLVALLKVSEAHSLRKRFSRIAVITDHRVKHLHSQPVVSRLQAENMPYDVISFPEGETFKTRETKASLENALLEKGFDRSCAIVALGGGVVLDLVGFLASTYMRGVALYFVPTTLTAMVDACCGGKNGVNTAYGKNTIGTRYEPEGVFINPSFLATVSPSEHLSGLAEIVKHGLIYDKAMVYKVVRGVDFDDYSSLSVLIEKNLHIKMAIISKGFEDTLNFGHTLGHALETFFKYRILHGQAVFVGMVFASFLSFNLGYLREENLLKIEKLIGLIYPAWKAVLQNLCPEDIPDLVQLIGQDKRATFGEKNFVLLGSIGQPVKTTTGFCHFVEDCQIMLALKEFLLRYKARIPLENQRFSEIKN